jgi:hypothetical protein
MSRLILFLVLWLGCCGFALWRGGAPERIGSAIFLVAAVLSALFQHPKGSRFDSVEVGMLLVDMGVLAGFVLLAVVANRFWPLWMSGMQGVQVFSHLAIALNPEVIPWAYWNAETLWSYPMLVLLFCGTIAHRRRLRILGADASWKTSYARSTRHTAGIGARDFSHDLDRSARF